MSKETGQYFKGKVAIFIDAANIELSAKSKDWMVDYAKLYKWLKGNAEIVYIGFFTARFNTKKHDAFLTVLKRIGYKLITKPLKIIRNQDRMGHTRKVNFDVEIAVEAIRQVDSYNTVVLFSGDSDFDYLLKELRKQGKIAVVVSMKYHISKELIKRANFYLDLRKIRKIIERRS